jgi:hypothetical protein
MTTGTDTPELLSPVAVAGSASSVATAASIVA